MTVRPWAWIAVAVASAGCGRLGYDLLAGGDDDDSVIVDGRATTVGDGAPGSDGRPGDAAAVTPTLSTAEQRLTSATGPSLHPVVAWSGSALYVLWDDLRRGNLDLYLARITPGAALDLRDVRLTTETSANGFPTAVWAGDHLAIAWEDDRDGNSDVYFATLDADGARIGGEVALTTSAANSFDPAMVWTGGEHAVAFHEGDETHTEVLVRRVGTDRVPVGRAVVQSSGAALSQFSSLVWTGGGFGATWQDNRDGVFAAYVNTITSAGQPAQTDRRATSAAARATTPVLAWNGQDLGLAWTDARNGGNVVYFAHLDASGKRIGSEVPLSGGGDAHAPAIVWTGTRYGVAWTEDGIIFLAVLDAAGDTVTGPLQVSGRPAIGDQPALTWTGSQFAVAWQDTRNGEAEIYVRAVTP